ncbi:MAG: S-layer homology domain-containing protein, partial [bacterium]|nr:S-layer homology domain-containing protein [bacterium]
ITAMVLSALAPYYNAQEDKYGVKECVEKGIACLSNLQKEDGLYAYGNAKNSNTAAMVIVALSALGIDADKDPRFIKNEVSALDALLAFETSDHKIGYTDNKSANNMATEQGFRALVNYKAFKENSGPAYVYQFIKTIDPPEPSPSQPSGGSGSGSSQPATITVSFQLIGDSHHEKAENHKEKETWIAAKSYTVSEKATVKDVFEKALSEAGLSYINKGGNYISSINGLAEFDNGPNSGWMYMINGKHPTVGLKDYVLQGGETIVWHYTDDYTKEEGSDKWGSKPSETPSASSGGSGGGGGGSNANSQTPAAQETKSEETTPDQIEANTVHISFTDVKEGHWAKEAIETLANAGIIQGKSETKYAPNENITRAEFITLLYRMSKQEIENSNEMAFKDVKADDWFAAAVNWGVNAGIIKGMDAENFMPQSLITREQMAAMLARYIQYMQVVLIAEDNKEAFKDEVSISDYAKEPVKTLHLYNIMQGKGQNNFVPKVTATRAETAQVLFILFKSNEK